MESLLQLLVNNDDNYHAQSSPPADLFSQNINNYHQHHLQSTQPRQQQQHLRIRIHAKRSLAPGAATSVFLEKQAHSPELAGAASTLSRSTFKAEIHTYFYILGSGYQARVQHKHIEMQMRVLNDAYRDAGFGFKLKGFENIARTIMRSSSRGDSGVGGGIISEQFVKTVRSNHDRGEALINY